MIPAIHVHAGQAVQLDRGAVGSEVALGDALDWARRFADEGAQWLHLVDLDALRGEGDNDALCREVVDLLTPRTRVLYAGGRDEDTLRRLLDGGVGRVLVGTHPADTPAWVAQVVADLGDRAVVGLDVGNGDRPGPGWAQHFESYPEAVESLNDMGASRVVVRCLSSDGRLTGPNYELLGGLCARTQAAVVASGGIATIEDLRRLRGLVSIGVEGAVVGTALSRGAFTLPEALRIATGERPVSPEIGRLGRLW